MAAPTLATQVYLNIAATLQQIGATALVPTVQAIVQNPTYSFASGTGANQADSCYGATRTLAASANEDLSMNGTLVDGLGNTFTTLRIRLLLISAAAGNTNNVLIGKGGSNPMTTLFTGTSPVTIVRPGGLWLVVANDATGYGVTASTAMTINIANSAGTTGVTYTVVAVGCSA